ncbi:hypothetical protein B0H13DRAFT_2275673 [Mycena leptocephala]|nr:hypothetical protein B0H13DRAFT_2275673 [Mycena leptocephala]
MKMDSLQRSLPDRSRSTEDGEDLEDFVWRAKAGRVGHQHRTSPGARLQRSFPDRSRSPLNRRTLKTERTSKTSSGAQRRAESVINTERRQEHDQYNSHIEANGTHSTMKMDSLERSFPDRSRSPLNRRTLKTERTSKTSSGAPRRAESVIDTERRQEHDQYNSHIKANGTHSTMKMDSLERSFPDRSRSPLYRRTLKTERASKTSSGAPRQAESVINTERRQEHAWRDRSPRSRSPFYRRTLKTERTSKTSSGALRQAESVINTERRQEYGQWHSLDNENGQLAEIVPRPQPQPAQQAHTEDGEDLAIEDFVWRAKAGRRPQPQPQTEGRLSTDSCCKISVNVTQHEGQCHSLRIRNSNGQRSSFPDHSRSPLNRRTLRKERTERTFCEAGLGPHCVEAESHRGGAAR